MNVLRLVSAATSAAVLLQAAAAAADDSAERGRKVFEQRCQTCHGGTAPASSPIGPSLAGIVGRKAGTGDSGVHSRAAIDSGTVWTRDALRRFLSEPGKALPGTYMPVSVQDPKQLDDLLDYLETLR